MLLLFGLVTVRITLDLLSFQIYRKKFTLLNNQFQLEKWEKERDEHRREAKIQAEEKWIERDILALMDSIDNILRGATILKQGLFQAGLLEYKLKLGFISKENADKEKLLVTNKYLDLLDKIDSEIVALKQAYSFEGEIASEFERFNETVEKFEFTIKKPQNLENLDEMNYDKQLYKEVCELAGNLQRLLREKLISLRYPE